MSSQRIQIFIGTKAQLIKMAPVILSLESRNIQFDFILTGQHETTINELITSFNIKTKPSLFLPLIETNSIFSIIRWWLSALIKLASMPKIKNTIVITHGDTLSTLLAGLYAKRTRGKLAHIEAGLRSFNWFNPFPEEAIRVLVSRLSDIFYAPGEWALGNLEKYNGIKVNTYKNTIIDSLIFATKQSSHSTDQQYAIASIHRFENLKNQERLKFIISHIISASKLIPIKFVMHPVTIKQLKSNGILKVLKAEKGIELIKRMNYVDFTNLLANSNFLITDGGSNQEECYYMGLPCLLMRQHTERNEGLGQNVILAKFDSTKVCEFIDRNIEKSWKFNIIDNLSPSEIIVNHLLTSK